MSRHASRIDGDRAIVDGDGAFPAAPLREARVLVDHDAVGRCVSLPGFLDHHRARSPREIGRECRLVRTDGEAEDPHRLDDLDADGSHPGRAVERHAARGEHRVLDAVDDDAERRVDHPEDRIVTHGATDEEGTIALVSVEEVAVVVVGVTRGRCGDRVGAGVDREVVPWREHGSTFYNLSRNHSNVSTAVSGTGRAST